MIQPLSDIQSKHIGADTNIWQYCVILPDAVIGSNCNICACVFIENRVVIGNNVTIKNGVQLWDGITIEDNVFIGPNATFTNERIPRSKSYDSNNLMSTLVRNGATIGANATILPGIIIGEHAFIGAGSVVTCDIPAYTLYFGNPATHRGYITDSGVVLDLQKRDKNGVIHPIK